MRKEDLYTLCHHIHSWSWEEVLALQMHPNYFVTCRTTTGSCKLCCRQLQEAVVAHTESAAATTRMLTAELDAAIAARDKALADAAAKDAAVAAANEARSAAEAEATHLRSRPAAPIQGVLFPW